jgi:hypothetical protein
MSPRQRQIGYDNCRNLFMFYVVMYHFFNNENLTDATRDWSPHWWADLFRSYTLWHEKLAVPGFAFLSGLFGEGYAKFHQQNEADIVHKNGQAKKVSPWKNRWRSSISTLLVGAVFVQWMDMALHYLVVTMYKNDGTGELTFPHTVFDYDHLETWYLLALFSWRLMTPFFSQLVARPEFSSILLAYLSAHSSFEWSAHVRMRIFRFFPFYIAGLQAGKEMTLNRIKNPTLAGMCGLIYTWVACANSNDQEYYFSIKYFGFDWSIEGNFILFYQVWYSLVLVQSIVLLVRKWITFPLFPGSHASSTLAIYAWHWRILDVLLWGDVPFSNGKIKLWSSGWRPAYDYFRSCTSDSLWKDPFHHPLVAILLLHSVSYAICLVLGSKWAWKAFKYINAPNLGVFWFREAKSNEEGVHEDGSDITGASIIAADEESAMKIV